MNPDSLARLEAGGAYTTDDGGPAFPQAKVTVLAEDGTPNEACAVEHGGMSMRDHFAGLAMHALIAEPVVPGCAATVLQFALDGPIQGGPDRYAYAAYKMADAMIQARKGTV